MRNQIKKLFTTGKDGYNPGVALIVSIVGAILGAVIVGVLKYL